MVQQPQSEFRAKLETLFMVMAIVVFVIVLLWVLLGTYFMQLFIAGCLFGGIFCLGAWMNDKSQNRHTKAMLEATNALSHLVIQTNRGLNRIEAKQIEAQSQMDVKRLEVGVEDDEIVEVN